MLQLLLLLVRMSLLVVVVVAWVVLMLSIIHLSALSVPGVSQQRDIVERRRDTVCALVRDPVRRCSAQQEDGVVRLHVLWRSQ